MNNSVFIIDDFYSNPKTIRRQALDMKFVEPEDLVGWRTTQGVLPKNIIEIIHSRTGLNVSSMQMPQGTPYDNGTYFMSFFSGANKEKPGVHWDLPLNEMLCLVYLTEDIPVECGTSFYRHKKTGLENAPTIKDARRLDISKQELVATIQRERHIKSRFIETDKVGYKFNRAIIFPSKRLHAATKHHGNNIETGRIFQVFSFKI